MGHERGARAALPDHYSVDGEPPGAAVLVIGYASARGAASLAGPELKLQTDLIVEECHRRGLELVDIVQEREPESGKALERPGLTYALRQIGQHRAAGLVITRLARLTRSAAELGTVVQWLTTADARLVAISHGLDTARADGRLSADLLIEVADWERERLSERTRKGLAAARSRGRPAVTDNPELRERITAMRQGGMSLQAIADQLNSDGVPTVRGGRQWRHSSIQRVLGYQRQRAGSTAWLDLQPDA